MLKESLRGDVAIALCMMAAWLERKHEDNVLA